jgi:hypothetical protein
MSSNPNVTETTLHNTDDFKLVQVVYINGMTPDTFHGYCRHCPYIVLRLTEGEAFHLVTEHNDMEHEVN